MVLFDIFYGGRCRSPIRWFEVVKIGHLALI